MTSSPTLRGWYDKGALQGRRVLPVLGPQSVLTPDGFRTSPMSPVPLPAVTTLFQALKHGADQGPRTREAIGYRKSPTEDTTWISWDDLFQRVKAVAHGLPGASGGEATNVITHVGILSAPRYEATLIDLALDLHSRVSVHLNPFWAPSTLAAVIKKLELKIVCVDTLERLNTVLSIKAQIPSLKEIIIMVEGPLSDAVSGEAEKAGLKLTTLEAVEDVGDSPPHWENLPSGTDTKAILFTRDPVSPKAIEVKHAAVVAQVAGMLNFLGQLNMGTADVLYSNYSLAFAPQRVLEAIWAFAGCRLLFGAPGESEEAVCKAGKPTVVHLTPKLLANLRRQASKLPGVDTALRSKEPDLLSQPPVLTNSGTSDGTLGPLREMFGGRLKLVLTCLEPLSWSTLKMIRLGLAVPVMEGFLMAEAAGVVSTTHPWDAKGQQHVGGPLPGIRIKLRDVPELGLRAAVGAGEVNIAGPSVSSYYQDVALQTAKHRNGLLETGDLAMWRQDGTLQLLGRKGEAWKKPNGEFVNPALLEAVYRRSELVQQVMVVPGPGGALIGALVVANPAITPPPTKDAILADMRRESAADGLRHQLHNIAVVPELSPAHIPSPWPRLNRPHIAAHHAAILPSLFA